jgi:hypothetical protein
MPPDDDEYTDRPPKPPEKDEDGEAWRRFDGDPGPNPFRRVGFLDRQFGQSSLVMLFLFPLVAGGVALLLALAGVVACQDPRARRNAWIVLAMSLPSTAALVALLAFGRH